MRRGGIDWAARFGQETSTTLERASPFLSRCLAPETPVLLPDSLPMLQEILQYAAASGLCLWPAGGMEHSTHGGLPETVDAVVSLQRLARLVDVEPGDLTMVVEAGAPLHAVAARLHEAGLCLSADPWPGTAASIGGAVAANRSGPARLRAGTLRDALLGCRVVHADGTTTRSGGRVVKNVTGFDLPKLYVGSFGTLVVLMELNLRLSSLPEASALVWAHGSSEKVRAMLLEIHRHGPRPVSLVAFQGQELPAPEAPAESVHVAARFEGREARVRQEARDCARAWQGEELPAAKAQALWEAFRQHGEPGEGRVVLQVSSLPTAGVDLLQTLRPHLHGAGSALALYGVGTCSVRLPAGLPVADAVALQERLEAQGHGVRWLHAEGAERLRLRGSRPASAALHEATKSLFDAGHVFPVLAWRDETRSA